MTEIVLKTYNQISSAAPWQAEGTTVEGQDFYARSRHGGWRIELDGVIIADGSGHIFSLYDLSEASGINIIEPE